MYAPPGCWKYQALTSRVLFAHSKPLMSSHFVEPKWFGQEILNVKFKLNILKPQCISKYLDERRHLWLSWVACQFLFRKCHMIVCYPTMSSVNQFQNVEGTDWHIYVYVSLISVTGSINTLKNNFENMHKFTRYLNVSCQFGSELYFLLNIFWKTLWS